MTPGNLKEAVLKFLSNLTVRPDEFVGQLKIRICCTGGRSQMHDFELDDLHFMEHDEVLFDHPDQILTADVEEIRGVPLPVWCGAMHGLQTLWFVGGLGVFISLAVWLYSRRYSAVVDYHARSIGNWILTELSLLAAGGIVVFFQPGLMWPLSVILLSMSLVFPLLGMTYALSGVVWRYWLVIDFLPDPRSLKQTEISHHI